MNKSWVPVFAIAALARTAAADTFTLPGTNLSLTLPDGRYGLVDSHGSGLDNMLGQRGTHALWSGDDLPVACPKALDLAIQGGGSLQAAPEAPAGWSPQRGVHDHINVYCRERGDRALVVILISDATTDAPRIAIARPLLAAVEAALASGAPPAAPVAPVTTSVPRVGTISLPGDRYRAGPDAIEHIATRALLSTGDDSTGCAGYMQWATKVGNGKLGTSPAVGALPTWYAQRFDLHAGWVYCRDLPGGGDVRLMVDNTPDDARIAEAIGPFMAAIDRAVEPPPPPAPPPPAPPPPITTAASTPPPPDDSRYTPPPITTAAVTPAPPDDTRYTPPPASTTHEYRDREPATYDTSRWGLVGGQSTLDRGAETHAYGAARVQIAPRVLDEDDGDDGASLVFSAGAAAGAAGDAFVADAYSGGGFGLSGSGLAARALVVVGLDRVGGGFEPDTGAYLGLQGFLRVGFGALALEGDGMITTSSGVDETRAQVSAVTHVGDRVLAIGGFYQRWDALAEIYGVSIGLTR